LAELLLIQILVASLALIDIPAHTVANDKELLFELVLKNLYTLGIDFRADCNSPSPVQTKINSGSINERNSSISVALILQDSVHQKASVWVMQVP
jgi:hypothetical protein